MAQPLIRNISKVAHPQTPGYVNPLGIAVVPGLASVPVEIGLQSIAQIGEVGVDIVFLIDNSGSMDGSDPSKERFVAIKQMAEMFEGTRNDLDRVAIITFQGSAATLAQDWSSWTQTKSSIPTVMQSTVGGVTPMESAMEMANQMLTAASGFYRIAILLSDGDPFPDTESQPQTWNIVSEVVPDAATNRVIYSTVYFAHPNKPEDNALLMYIARETDYVTDYSPGDPPVYYARITGLGQLLAKYTALFTSINTRIVPQDVGLSERINDRLLIDPLAPVSFSGDGFEESSNVISADSIAAACEELRTTKRFSIRLNELDGDAALRFSVKLDRDSVTDSDYDNGFIEVDVDVPQDSSVGYLQPINNGASRVNQSLGQTTIRFTTGLQAVKHLDQVNNSVGIEITNLDSAEVPWYELVEYPSVFVDAYQLMDNLESRLFESLFETAFPNWFFNKIVGANPQRASILDRSPVERQLTPLLANILKQAHRGLLRRSAEVDERLSSFFFSSRATESNAFWRTTIQIGTYKLCKDLPALATRRLDFKVRGASYRTDTGQHVPLASPVDAIMPKHGVSIADATLSYMRSSGWSNERTILPNPDFHQLVPPEPKPDLVVLTCFAEEDIHLLRSLFSNPRASKTWTLLNSRDIDLQVGNTYPMHSVGNLVRITNVGDAPAHAHMTVCSYFIPFIGAQWPIPAGDPSGLKAGDLDWSPMGPFVAEGETSADLDPHESKRLLVDYHMYRTIRVDGTTGAQLRPSLLPRIEDAIVVTTVDVRPAENELMLANNHAIEVVRLTA